MSDLLQADIFFFITSISVILITAALIVVFIYASQVLREVRAIVRRAKKEVGDISDDLGELRGELRKEGGRIKEYLDAIAVLVRKKRSPRRNKSK